VVQSLNINIGGGLVIFERLRGGLVICRILFPINDRAIFTGTFHDHDIMYDRMIIAFNIAIGSLGKEEQAIA
jgi:hypothetical protein